MAFIYSLTSRKRKKRARKNNFIFRLLETNDTTERFLENDSKRFLEHSATSPVYALSRSATSVVEGDSVTFTLNSIAASVGTAVPYTITGVTTQDINGAPLTGNFVLNSAGSATLTLDITYDAVSETSKVLVITAGNSTSSVLINDQSRYTLTRSATHVNEGEFVTFILNTVNVPVGTEIPYVIGGTITSDDIGDVPLNGVFIANSSGVESLTLDITADALDSEGPEVVTLSVGEESTSVIINDNSSTTPVYALTRSISRLNEGENVTFTLTTANVSEGTNVPYTITGVTNDDIGGASLTGNFVVGANGIATLTLFITLDQLNEDVETLTLSLNGLAVSSFVKINDTSLPQSVSYALSRTPTSSSVNEGSTVTFTLTTTNVTNGTKIPYTIRGVTSDDIGGAPVTGEFTINSNKATLSLTITADASTEGAETLILSLDNLNVLPISVNINDTSKTPTYALSNSSTDSTIDEGNSLTFTLTTTNVSANTKVPYSISGVTSLDISGAPLTGDFTVGANGTATLTLAISADATTEGAETITLAAGGKSSSVTINDTSKTPTYTLTRSPTTESIDEGNNLTFTLTTTNVSANTKVPYTISGVTRADIGNASLTGDFTVGATGTATLTLAISADAVSGETETLTLTAAGQTSSIVINDKTPTYTLTRTPTTASVDEGSSVTFTLTTTNISDGTKIPYTISGVSNADIGGASTSGNFTVNSNSATLTLDITLDSATDASETLTLTAAGQTSSIVINDKTPTYTITRSPVTSSVNEGTTVTFTLTTTNVANTTKVPYTITGVSSTDINNASLTGEFTIGTTGTATLPITFTNDSLTEGPETLTLTLNTPGTNSSVTINDTSKTPAPTYTLTRSPNTTTVDEGTTVTFTLTTTNVSNGTLVPYTITGVSSADISNASLTGNFTVDATGTATLQITFSNDLLTEGSETATLTLNTPGTNISVTINDTSLEPARLIHTQKTWSLKGTDYTETEAVGGYATSVNADGTVVVNAGRTASNAPFLNIGRWNDVSLSWDYSKINLAAQDGEIVTSISDDGNVIAVGFEGLSGGYSANTNVIVYEWNASSWSQRGSAITTRTYYCSIDISGDGSVLAIGEPYADISRRVRVFKWSGSSWNAHGNVITVATTGSNEFGWKVSLNGSGDTVAVGTASRDSGVDIYRLSGGTWSQLGSRSQYETDGFGGSDAVKLDSSGDFVAIAGYLSQSTHTGTVRVFRWTGSTWIKVGNDISQSGNYVTDEPDVSLSMDGTASRIIVGTRRHIASGGDGTIKVYDWNGIDWELSASVLHAVQSNFGYNPKLSRDGQTMTFGAPNTKVSAVYTTVTQLQQYINLPLNQSTISPPINTAVGYTVSPNIAFTGPQIQSAVKRLGAQYSAFFPRNRTSSTGTANVGSGGMYSWPSAIWNRLDDDFVIECWAYLPAANLNQIVFNWGGPTLTFLDNAICGTGDPSRTGNVLSVWHAKDDFTNAKLRMYNMNGSYVESTSNFALNAWNKIRVSYTKATTTTLMHINDVQVANSNLVSFSITDPNIHGDNFYIGGRDANNAGEFNWAWNGYISDFKLYTKFNMSFIPQGSFTMGDSLDNIANAIPVHSVTLDAFYIGKYEVTKAEWNEVRTWGLNNGYTDLGVGSGKANNHPVQSITWYDMVKWCNARSQREGLTPAYYTNDARTAIYKTGNVNVTNVQVDWTANGYRLPTEAEWEKAARGGLSGKRFPWGDTITQAQANYSDNPTYRTGLTPYTSPAGAFAANGYGLYDMTGNISEHCWDWFGSYAAGNQTNPRGPASGVGKVIRGGSWSSSVNSPLRVAERGFGGMPGSSDTIGFRVVRSKIN